MPATRPPFIKYTLIGSDEFTSGSPLLQWLADAIHGLFIIVRQQSINPSHWIAVLSSALTY